MTKFRLPEEEEEEVEEDDCKTAGRQHKATCRCAVAGTVLPIHLYISMGQKIMYCMEDRMRTMAKNAPLHNHQTQHQQTQQQTRQQQSQSQTVWVTAGYLRALLFNAKKWSDRPYNLPLAKTRKTRTTEEQDFPTKTCVG